MLQGAWALLLGAHGESRPVVFGVTDAERPPEIPGMEQAVGLFITTLPMVVELKAEEALVDTLHRLQRGQAQGREHAGLHLAEVQRLAPAAGGEALFDTLFVYESYPVDARLTAEDTPLRVGTVRAVERTGYALTLVVLPGAQLGLRLTTEARRLDDATLSTMGDRLVALLEQIAARPDLRVGELSALTEADRGRLLDWNNTAAPVTDLPVHALFEAQVRRTPDSEALVFEDQSLSYAELNAAANRLAWRLRGMGVGPEVRVGIALPRGLEMVIAVLGVLKAGGAYVPLDPTYPEARLRFMAEDAQIAVLLAEDRLGLPADVALLAVEAVPQASTLATGSEPVAVADAGQPAYVIYTSGSTGRPKGVVVPHRALSNLLSSMSQRTRFGAKDVLLGVTTLSFDIAGLELFLPLIHGATLVLASSVDQRDPAQLWELILRHRVSVMQATPSTWAGLCLAAKGRTAHLQALCGGEALPPALAAELRLRFRSLLNVYGPTETTIWSCAGVSDDRADMPAIGSPLTNTQVYVTDHSLGLHPPASLVSCSSAERAWHAATGAAPG